MPKLGQMCLLPTNAILQTKGVPGLHFLTLPNDFNKRVLGFRPSEV
jgi:hypothetical protein